MSELERIIRFAPAFDKRHPDPRQNYGIHGVEMRAVVRGEWGAVQFVLFTGWMLPHVTEELRDHGVTRPLPADLGYHSPVPRYEGQERRGCEWLPQGFCFYDGSGLAANGVFQRLLTEGDAGMWAFLETYYRETFETPGQVVGPHF